MLQNSSAFFVDADNTEVSGNRIRIAAFFSGKSFQLALTITIFQPAALSIHQRGDIVISQFLLRAVHLNNAFFSRLVLFVEAIFCQLLLLNSALK